MKWVGYLGSRQGRRERGFSSKAMTSIGVRIHGRTGMLFCLSSSTFRFRFIRLPSSIPIFCFWLSSFLPIFCRETKTLQRLPTRVLETNIRIQKKRRESDLIFDPDSSLIYWTGSKSLHCLVSPGPKFTTQYFPFYDEHYTFICSLSYTWSSIN